MFQRNYLLLAFLVAFPLLEAPAVRAAIFSSSQLVTWTCSGSPCNWGDSTTGNAIAWPESLELGNVRLGYTVSAGIYLPASFAAGLTITIESGSANVYAGAPDAPSHDYLAGLSAGQSYVVSGLAADEVISVQNDLAAFTYSLTSPPPPVPQEPPGNTVPEGSSASQLVTWNCTGTPCNWGQTSVGNAVVWADSAGAGSARLGYTTSAPIYLPASAAAGLSLTITAGAANVYAGRPGDPSHQLLATVGAGETYQVGQLAADTVLSIQNDVVEFAYSVVFAPPQPTEPPAADPEPNEAESSVAVIWTCTASPCDWGDSAAGNAIAWPVSLGPTANRLGYTTEPAIYLPASAANGLTITIVSGSANLYAGDPDAPGHRFLAALGPGHVHTVSGLAGNEVLSVQNDLGGFSYTLTLPAEVPPEDPSDPGPVDPDPSDATASQAVTWTCTGSPCDWGYSSSGNAVVWPSSLEPTSTRLGYTTSKPIYLPAATATGITISIDSGTANVYAGAPNAVSHRFLASLNSGDSFVVSGLAANEVVSVQNDAAAFTYTLTVSTIPPVEEPTDPIPEGASASAAVTWACAGSPCNWGDSASGNAIVWPESWGAASNRLGYVTSLPIYLPASAANGIVITIESGTASVYAGAPNAPSHSWLATLNPGESYTVSGLPADAVLSVQNDTAGFVYRLGTSEDIPGSPDAGCTDPLSCDPVSSILSYWHCNTEGCSDSDWVGAVVNWPSWAAYSTNARNGSQSRTVYSFEGELLHPYMGSWASGCQVTATEGLVLIIEWERGTDVWRETLLEPGQTYTINLVPPENGAMIEGLDYSPGFAVSLSNCNPQPIHD